MSPVLIAVVSVVLLLIIALFVWKITSENAAKRNYKPPIASEKIVLPEMRDDVLPAKSGKNLQFCASCGAPNSDQSTYCTSCGAKL